MKPVDQFPEIEDMKDVFMVPSNFHTMPDGAIFPCLPPQRLLHDLSQIRVVSQRMTTTGQREQVEVFTPDLGQIMAKTIAVDHSICDLPDQLLARMQEKLKSTTEIQDVTDLAEPGAPAEQIPSKKDDDQASQIDMT